MHVDEVKGPRLALVLMVPAPPPSRSALVLSMPAPPNVFLPPREGLLPLGISPSAGDASRSASAVPPGPATGTVSPCASLQKCCGPPAPSANSCNVHIHCCLFMKGWKASMMSLIIQHRSGSAQAPFVGRCGRVLQGMLALI